MYKSAVNNNAEGFSKDAIDVYPMVAIEVTFVSTLWIGVISPWFQILGKMPELRMMLNSLNIANWNLLSVYFIVSLRIPSTPRPFWVGWFYFVL